jgi:hypothetical protein
MGTCPRSTRMMFAAAVMHPVIASLLVRAVEKARKARAEIVKMLQGFGCEQVGFMDNFDDCSVLLAFTHRGRQVQLRASARGWAAMYLKKNPWSSQRRVSRPQWERAALDQRLIAVNSILRDWVPKARSLPSKPASCVAAIAYLLFSIWAAPP